ncbi:MAG TPA: sulfotransferase family 2 domain-containing protein, partial [Afifellaceae bacterium]|nr:sulfotransferase family 2 domain-containing protein [Afifellaceae bacterium]
EPAPRRVVFLHIPKTAGSSVNAHFKHHLGSSLSRQAVGLNAAAGIDRRQIERARRARFVFGHFGWQTLEAVRGDGFAFTVLRDPAARVVSLYRFARRRELPHGSGFEALMAAARADFDKFCLSDDPEVRPFIDNAQARTLAAGYMPAESCYANGEAILEQARAHLATLDFVGLTERLDEDFAALTVLAGLPPPRAALQRNVGDGAPASGSLEEARAILGERIALDQALYDFARALRADGGQAREASL